MSYGPRLAVFDLDGTLVDSVGHIARAVNETADALKIKRPHADAIPRVIGLSLDTAIARLFPEADAKTHAEADRVYRKIFAEWRAQPGHVEPLFPGTAEAIAALESAGYLLGIATGKARRGVDFLLDHHGLSGRFITIQTPDIAPGKPDPGMLIQAMSETGIGPENVVMIGDTVYDIGMAVAAGTHALGVSWGNHPAAELTDAGAHKIIDRMDEVLHAVDTLTARK
ncbi:MAG: HAD-IA family hydrolase [Rhodospirillaceae bacterium]|nr:HAD-IA family hydrolase [Rhodospirillaceae bacterium]